MKRCEILISLLVCCVVGVLVGRADAQAPDAFIIDKADAQIVLGVQPSQNLNSLIGNVINHFLLDRADGRFDTTVGLLPDALQGLANQVRIHYIVDRADKNMVVNPLYPALLINDHTPPVIIKNIVTTSGGAQILVIETDEFTTIEVLYGFSSGNYPNSLKDPLYKFQHQLVLPSISAGQVLFVLVRAADRNTNMTTASELRITAYYSQFLPVIRR